MIDVSAIVEAARKEIGVDAIQTTPVRISCPTCGGFAVSVMTLPCLARARCGKCHVDLLALVTRDRAVLVVQDK